MMSKHTIPLTAMEEAGLRAHGLPVGTPSQLADAFRDGVAWALQYQAHGDGQQGAEWRAKWPNHCQACGGWGGKNHVQSQPYGSTTAGESLFDPCTATGDAKTCHRCGQEGLTDEGDGPCRHCGWDCNDGDPDRS